MQGPTGCRGLPLSMQSSPAHLPHCQCLTSCVHVPAARPALLKFEHHQRCGRIAGTIPHPGNDAAVRACSILLPNNRRFATQHMTCTPVMTCRTGSKLRICCWLLRATLTWVSNQDCTAPMTIGCQLLSGSPLACLLGGPPVSPLGHPVTPISIGLRMVPACSCAMEDLARVWHRSTRAVNMHRVAS